MTTRTDVRFPVDGDDCAAWWYRPAGPGPAPVVVMAHGLGGTRAMRLDAVAERFVAAGYACLVFDYRHFGDSDGTPRDLLDIGRQLADWRAAVAHARSRTDADGTRVALWGTSFAGGHVVRIAADDGDIAAVISQCPFTDGISSALALHPLSALRTGALGIVDRVGALLGRAPRTVATVGPPRSTALMTAPDAEPGYRALQPDGTSGPVARVAARFALDIVRYRPGRSTARVTCPVLFTVCDRDSVAPARATLRHARRAPTGEIRRHDCGHFDVYLGDDFERVIAEQIGFLHRHLPPTRQ